MRKRTGFQGVASLACALALVACAGGGKQADSPGTCPEGTILKGDDCLPSEVASTHGGEATGAGDSKHDESAGSSASPQAPSDESPTPASAPSQGTSSGSDSPAPSSSSGKTPYDKDAVEVQLKRAARQIKANCGSATDDEGKASGPWGSTKAVVVLGRNGHIKQTTVPAPYDGKPVGLCVVHAFEKIWFPPYAGSNDVSVEWDIDIAPPKRH